MAGEVICVDDHPLSLESICMYVALYDLKPIPFENPLLVPTYLDRSGLRPAGFLVDMHIPKDLGSAEKLYATIQARGLERTFWFITACYSAADHEIINRTGAKYLLKDDLYGIEQALQAMSESLPQRVSTAHTST